MYACAEFLVFPVMSETEVIHSRKLAYERQAAERIPEFK
jgi:hypothetical protein